MSFLFDRALMLAKIEATFDVDAVPTAQLDALLVSEPDFTPDIAALERANVRVSLSNDPIITGRKIGQIVFTHEVRNNGNTDGTLAPLIGRCIRGCGFSETAITATSQQVVQVNNAANTGEIQFEGGSTQNVSTMIRRFKLTCTIAGGSGVAIVIIEAPAEGGLSAISMTDTDEVILTDGNEIGIHDDAGAMVAYITPNFQSDNPEVGDVYWVTVTPRGYVYQPISASFPSLTLYFYRPDDTTLALLHKLTGARGTFTVEAVGGQFGTFTFTMTGSYNAITDETMPTGPVYETQKPAQVELAALSLFIPEGDKITTLCASQFGLDMAIDVQPRECINNTDSYAGAIIVGRDPSLTFDPETVLEATHPFWANLAAATELEWNALVGRAKGNVVQFRAPNIQYSGLSYAERNGLLVYNVEANLAADSDAGDDEITIWFG